MEEDPQGVVLLDVSPGGDEDFDVSFLERNGHPVVVCHGPAVDEVCPLLDGQRCTRFEAAHGIVFKLDLDRPQHWAILRRYRELAGPGLPIRVVVDPEQAASHADALAEVEVWWQEPTVADLDGLAAEVEAADRAR